MELTEIGKRKNNSDRLFVLQFTDSLNSLFQYRVRPTRAARRIRVRIDGNYKTLGALSFNNVVILSSSWQLNRITVQLNAAPLCGCFTVSGVIV